MVSGGAFEFKGDIDLPTPAFLLINDSKDVWFDELILEPAELTVKVDTLTKLYDGKPICKVNMTHLKGGDTNSLLKSFYNIIDKKRSVMEGKSFPEMRQVYMDEVKEFLRQYPKEMASLILMERNSSGFSQQELISYYENFGTGSKNSYYGVRLRGIIDKNSKAPLNTVIDEFAQADLNGKPISISSLRGRYVLIDFWASWCIPCRKENPNFLKVYEKYKLKGFEVLGISIDNDRASWSNAVQQDNLNWLNVSDLKGRKNDVAVMFDIGAIPDNILIDREGKIIAKRISSQELEQLLAKAL